MGLRLPRLELRALVWATAAAGLSIAGGLFVAERTLVALDLALLCVAAVFVARHPLGALLAIIALRSVAPNTPLVDGVALFAVGVAALFAAPRLPGKRVIVPLAAFLAIAIVSTPLEPTAIEGVKDRWLRVPQFGWEYARNPSVPLYEWMRLASVLAVFCLGAWAVRTRAQLDRVVLAIIVTAVVPVFIGLKQFALGETVARSGQGDNFRAVIGPFSTPGPFAFYLVIVLCLAIVVFLELRAVAARVAIGALMAGAATCLLLTYTRSAWIAFALAVIAMALLRYRRLLGVGLLGLVIAAIAAPTVVDRVQQRFGDLTSRNEAQASNSLSWRTGNWSAILPYGYREPLTGQGFGSYPALTVDRFGTRNRRYPTIVDRGNRTTSARGFLAHNDYVRTFVEMGVPGLLLWVALLLGLLSASWRARTHRALAAYAPAGIAVALSMLLIAFSDNLLSAPVMLFAFAFIGALTGAAHAAGLQARRAVAVGGPAPVGAPGAVAQPEAAEPEPAEEPETATEQEPRSEPGAPPPGRLSRLRRRLDPRRRSRP